MGYLLGEVTPRAVVSKSEREIRCISGETGGVWKLRGGGAVKLDLCHVSVWHILLS